MRFHADLHIHSKYSRATSRDLDLEHLAWWAARKGIAVVATGDCVHPQWLAELKEKLVPAEPGVFRLRPEIEAEVLAKLPPSCRGAPARFMLSTEISTIYKKGAKTRKIHHLIYAPDFDAVDRLAARLAAIGNIASDGRPILGLDSRDLLEIALESGPDSYLVPAHIWTPWFAALGSQSGFDSIGECYGDLADNIFAVETGLSSDPAMNWRIAALDRYRLTSNSDAHSPGKLAREATFFDCAPGYFAIRRALETGEGYGGTVEFFPEEGKYHADGHRKCGVRLSPKETLALDGRCPVCGGPLTIGVLHRVETLADRSEAETTPPPTAGEVKSLVPLPEIIAEITGVGPSSKRVAASYDLALAKLGPELAILEDLPVEEIARVGSPLLGEAVSRLRAGAVIRQAGYDGEYGVIRLFDEGELATLRGGDLLFDAPVAKRKERTQSVGELARAPSARAGEGAPRERVGRGGAGGANADRLSRPSPDGEGHPLPQGERASQSSPQSILAALDPDQRAAAAHVEGPLLVIAGPGSGKTRMLTHRIAHLIAERDVAAECCLAVTFTRRAAEEMRERLARLLPSGAGDAPVHTFHSLGLSVLRDDPEAAGLSPGFRIAGEAERVAALAQALDVSEQKAASLLRRMSTTKRSGTSPVDEPLAKAIAAYSVVLTTRNWVDFDDLVTLAADALDRDEALGARIRERFRFVSVDEFQDVDEAQYRLLRLIAPPGANLCVIGDPDQAIYGFRGADASAFERFARDDPSATTVALKRNYRSSGTIVSAASQLIAQTRTNPPLAEIVRDMHERIAIHVAPTERAEAEYVVAEIESILGGHSFFSIDSGRGGYAAEHGLGFGDIAVLYRTDAQSAALVEALSRSGMPFKKGRHGLLVEKPAVSAILAELAARPGGTPLSDALAAAAASVAARADAPDASEHASAVAWLTQLAERSSDDRARFLEAAALANEADFFDQRADRIALLTMHAAKGLEFSVVFVVGLEDGLTPLRFGGADAEREAEERRLFYVAMTRAKDLLYLSRAEQRLWRGRTRKLEASPFLTDIESELLRDRLTEQRRRKPELAQLTLF
jgi:DNA helicase-2/ATP-dependent DNA helicase PcrA